MYPVFLSKVPSDLEEKMMKVQAGLVRVGAGLSLELCKELADFMLQVNSYYTNAMEGNPSKLKDIEKALDRKFSKDPLKRNYQLEHLAHIATQKKMMERLEAEPNLNICSAEFMCWLHEEFYSKLPKEFWKAEALSGEVIEIRPGELRERGVTVGLHHAPETKKEVSHWLARFALEFSPENLPLNKRVMALASSHHRLLWIHPFIDGNGRVARLFTAAYCARLDMASGLLWSVSRAFARKRSAYDEALAAVDRQRRHDFDGRGPLSEEDLEAFIRFFVDCCLDQLKFMGDLFDSKNLKQRFDLYLDFKEKKKELSKNAVKTMKHIFLSGEVRRGEVKEICNVEDRQANKIVKEVLENKLAKSFTPKGPLRVSINHDMANALFPDLV